MITRFAGAAALLAKKLFPKVCARKHRELTHRLPDGAMPASTFFRAHNRVALAALITAKVIGIGGLVVAVMGHRTLGGTLLALDGVLIATAIGVSLRLMRRREEEDTSQKAALAQMIREGTLKQFLRDLEAEGVSAPAASETTADDEGYSPAASERRNGPTICA